MSRKHTNQSNLPQQPKSLKNTVKSKMEQLTGINPDNETLESASQEKLSSIDSLCDELNSLKTKLKKKDDELTERLDDIKHKEEELQDQAKDTQKIIAYYQDRLASLELKQQDILEKEKTLLEQESTLAIREAEANAGFVGQHREALTTLIADLKKMKNEQMASLERYQAEFLDTQRTIDEERKKLALETKAEREKLEIEREEIQRELSAVEDKKEKLAVEKRIQEGWLTKKRKQLEEESAAKIGELETELERLQSYRLRELQHNKELKGQLSDFAELQRMLKQKNMETADELFNQIDHLESEIREYRRRLAGRPVEDLEQKVDDLQEENRELIDQLEDKIRELHQANIERHQRAMGVFEREQLANKNRVLEQHNTALVLATEQLRSEIEGLKDMQRGQEVFPALLGMDRDLCETRPTQPIPSLSSFIDEVQVRITQTDRDNPLYFDKDTLRLFVAGLAMSQLHILQGISGTGKTSLPKAFAKAVGGSCTIVPVQAGWRDRDDLVGHYNAFEKRFYEKECLQALYRAQTPAFSDRFNIVLLDEMNLSRPEQYFAEFLSALELHGSDRQVVLMEDSPAVTPRFLDNGRKIGISDNLWFIGTANHDETTFEFADKTQDRSFVLELARNDKVAQESNLKDPVIYSADSLKSAFKNAREKHVSNVEDIFKTLKEHEITGILEKHFGIGWGNRLERQAKQFIPALVETGGSASMGLDHLLATRLMRDGKITGRYDTKQEHLIKLYESLENVWEQCFDKETASLCLSRLSQEIDRKENV